MTALNRLSLLSIVASMLLFSFAGCGGAGGDGPGGRLAPSNFEGETDWGIEVEGARSFYAEGSTYMPESSVWTGGMNLIDGVLLDDDMPGGNDFCEMRIRLMSDIDPENSDGTYEATATLDRIYGKTVEPDEVLASYVVDQDDPETRLTVEFTKYDRITSGVRRTEVAGTFEGKLVDADKPDEYVTVRGTFDFTESD